MSIVFPNLKTDTLRLTGKQTNRDFEKDYELYDLELVRVNGYHITNEAVEACCFAQEGGY